MKLGRVVGNVVSTINHPVFEDRTLLLVDLVGPDGVPGGGYQIAVDNIGAGAGEMVLLLDEGNGARQVLRAPTERCRAAAARARSSVPTASGTTRGE